MLEEFDFFLELAYEVMLKRLEVAYFFELAFDGEDFLRDLLLNHK
jgi:hypothetical protein